jgi:hypothetical protein
MRTTLCILLLSLATLTARAQDGAFGASPAKSDEKPVTPTAPPTKDAPAMPESGAPAAPAAAPVAQPANLPSAAEIFKRSLQAIGGEAAVRKHTCMRMEGALAAAAMGMKGRMVVQALAPNLFLTSIDMDGIGSMKQGFDGTVGWTSNPMMGTQLLEGNTLEELRRSADFYRELDPGKVWKVATVKGVTDFGGLPCYEIAVEGDMGNGSLFYGVADGLARGMRLEVDTPMGKMPTTTRMVEYKPFDGLLIASKTEIEAMGAVQTMTVEKVDFTPIDPKVFELPPDVKALVASGKRSAPPATRPARNGAAAKPAPGSAKPAPGTAPKPAPASTP